MSFSIIKYLVDDSILILPLRTINCKLFIAESQKIVCMDKLGAQTSVVITYRVMVFTGNKFGAGTDANVHIIIFGAKDDTGSRYVYYILFIQTQTENDAHYEQWKCEWKT